MSSYFGNSCNKVNTCAWYKERCYIVPSEHDPFDWQAAMTFAMEWEERIPVGAICKNDRPPFGGLL